MGDTMGDVTARLARASIEGHGLRPLTAAPAPDDRPASRIPLRPIPYAYFDPAVSERKITPNTKVGVDMDGDLPGHTYGILAPYGRCILDGQAGCWTVADLKEADPDLENAQPHQGDTLVDYGDGRVEKLFTANLGGDAGHAKDQPWMKTANIQDFYENTSTQLARVRYYWGSLGLCFTGVIWPEIADDPRQLAKIEASGTSLHARPIEDRGGTIGLVGACLVNQPGLPLFRAASLHTSGIVTWFDGDTLHLYSPDAPEGTIAMTKVAAFQHLEQVRDRQGRTAFVASVGLIDGAGNEMVGIIDRPDDFYREDAPIRVVAAADLASTGQRAVLADDAPTTPAAVAAAAGGCGPCGKKNRDVWAEMQAGAEPCCEECGDHAEADDLNARFAAMQAKDLDARFAAITAARNFDESKVMRWGKGTKVEGPAGGGRFKTKTEQLQAVKKQIADGDKSKATKDLKDKLTQEVADEKAGGGDAPRSVDKIQSELRQVQDMIRRTPPQMKGELENLDQRRGKLTQELIRAQSAEDTPAPEPERQDDTYGEMQDYYRSEDIRQQTVDSIDALMSEQYDAEDAGDDTAAEEARTKIQEAETALLDDHRDAGQVVVTPGNSLRTDDEEAMVKFTPASSYEKGQTVVIVDRDNNYQPKLAKVRGVQKDGNLSLDIGDEANGTSDEQFPADWVLGVAGERKVDPNYKTSSVRYVMRAGAGQIDSAFARLAAGMNCGPNSRPTLKKRRPRRASLAEMTAEAFDAQLAKLDEEGLNEAKAQAEQEIANAPDDFTRELAQDRLDQIMEMLG